MQIKELKGLKSVKALNVYCKLVIGLSLTHLNKEKSIDDFRKAFEEYEIEKRKTLLKFACLLVQLEKDEVSALTSFAVDENNVAYEEPALAYLKPSEIVGIMSEVALKISEIKIFF
ncbi:MAG: hypothetical protein LBU09_00985 [Endomicrobium sp.]|jgi:uncharacterized protein YfbU (UPF0304 family)|nr:hypothetical protein [Endomicrobium sp.]